MDREFVIFGKYRWEVTDVYGYSITKSEHRDIKISSIFDTESTIDVIYKINLKGTSNHDLHTSMFFPKEKILKTISHQDGGLNVNLKVDKIEDCEKLIDMLIDGNSLEIMPVYSIEFLKHKI